MLTRLKKTKQKGFTLIELMVTIAIVGILAAIAVPAYQYYITKARYSELVVAGTEMKIRVSEAISTGTIANDLSSMTTINATNPNTPLTKGVQSVVVTDGGADKHVITVTPTDANSPITAADVLKFTGEYDKDSSRVKWTLCADNGAEKYVSEAKKCT